MPHKDDPLADNPPQFDTREEIASFIRDEFGADPMDISKDGQLSEQRISFGLSILNSWEDEPPADRGGRTERALMLEAERLESAGHEAGVDVDEYPDVSADMPHWLEHP